MAGGMPIDPGKVAIYIRWSTDDQGEGTTMATQLERCRHYLQSQGWHLHPDRVYVDDGYSGGTLDRPALTRLRADIRAGQITCVVVYKIDRLSRSVIDIVDLVLKEWEGHCYMKSATEEINTLSPAGKVFFYLLVSFAEYERSLIRERTMSGKRKRAEQGLNPGFRPPFGFVRGEAPGQFAVVAPEASLVRRIFALYLQGRGSSQIAHLLNSEGLTRRGYPWNPLMIRRMLANPLYMGQLRYGRTHPTAAPGTAPAQPTQVSGAAPAIVPERIWLKAARLRQAAAAGRGTGGTRPTYSPYLLCGVGRCRCGAPLTVKQAGGADRYYACSRRKRQGAAACDAGHARVAAIDQVIARRVNHLLARIAPVVSRTALADALQERAAQIDAQMRSARATLARLEERRERLQGDYRQGTLPASLYASELATLQQDEATEQNRLVTLQAQFQHLSAADQMDTDLSPLLLGEHLTVPERRHLLRLLTRSIWLYRPVRSAQPPVLSIEWVALEPDRSGG